MQKILAEKEAEDFLEKQGFKVAKRASAESEEKLKSISEKIKFPWVMKASSKKLVHKAKLGGVIVNVKNIEEARTSFEKLAQIPSFEEAIVQEMIEGEEVIIGLKKTSEFGIVIMFGKGGTNVEHEKDVSFRIIPASKQELKKMISETKVANLIREKNIKSDLLEKTIFKTKELAKKYPNIIEFDINPLFLNNKSAVVADARIVFEE